MKLTRNCNVLGCVVIALAIQKVLALPTPSSQRGIITLPLHRVRSSSGDVHPRLTFQQHINRSQRRLARMNRRAGPSDEELRANLVKRMSSLGDAAYATQADAFDDNQTDKVTSVADPPIADNSLHLDIEGADLGYYANIQIGTPLRDFRVTMDSGSSDLWVGGEGCKGHRGCGRDHRLLGPSSSSTFVDTKQPWDITYGSGSVSGNIVTDDIVIAGLPLSRHKFGVAYKESSDFSDDSIPYDGLMGLALSSLSDQKTITPVEAMAKQGLIQEAITSYRISRSTDHKNDGEITFGGLDNTKYDASTLVTLENISGEGFWEANMDAITVDGVDMRLVNRTAILDTGTTLILAPPNDAKMIHEAIKGAKPDGEGGFIVPCTTMTSIALTFGDKVFTIEPSDLAAQPLRADEPRGECFSGIVADTDHSDGPKQWLLGDVFLKNAYFSTNASKNTLSLAKPI